MLAKSGLQAHEQPPWTANARQTDADTEPVWMMTVVY